jgi:autonomous glycyl radical cofactor GrcA
MRSDEAFPSKFMKSADTKTKPIIATISHMEMELVGQGNEQKQKPVLYLEGEKPMVLNRTNFEALEDAFGDSDDWPGLKIKVRCERTKFQGKTVDGLRIDPVVAKPAPKDELDDTIEL